MRKKIDNRIRYLIENGVVNGHRSMFLIIGKKSRDQVVILHHILSKSIVKSRPSVLWCYKKDLGFSSHRKKRMKQMRKQIRNGNIDVDENDPFEFFISSTNIRYCYYSETNKILGNTYGMCILQDFEALTPNIMAQTIETVEGGGIIIFLLPNISALKELSSLTMDIHSRYKTEVYNTILSRFNERFLLSLTQCKNCLLLDDQLNLISITSQIPAIEKLPPKPQDEISMKQIELSNLKESFQDVSNIGGIVKLTRTLDQAKALLKFVDVISEKPFKQMASIVCLTASRGRGKSACLGLSVACSIALGYSNIFVTSPNPENLKTLFDFVIVGIKALGYEEHIDFETIRSTDTEHNKSAIKINVFKKHRQTIQYIHPNNYAALKTHCEILVIDEAAAIPLPIVKLLLGPYICFMSSTISGYEGTGRSLFLKLFKQLRQRFAKQQQITDKNFNNSEVSLESSSNSLNAFIELKLNEPIRYNSGDEIEAWLNKLLCLSNETINDSQKKQFNNNGYLCPQPDACQLYQINRDALFSYHPASEAFLHKLVNIYVASHYKNTPNDLQMLADAPAHQIFCLIGPYDPNISILPDILCVIQVCLEGKLSAEYVNDNLTRGKKAFGDLIPWNIAQQFQDYDFPNLAGGRIVRIATHPDYQRMGYGQRALYLLTQYYSGGVCQKSSLYESIKEKTDNMQNKSESMALNTLPTLLLKMEECQQLRLDYLGVSYGLTIDLLRFWKKNVFLPVYLRQTPNDITGEHSCIMLKKLDPIDKGKSKERQLNAWLNNYFRDFRRRFIRLLSFQFKHFSPSLALTLIILPSGYRGQFLQEDNTPSDNNNQATGMESLLTYPELLLHFSLSDIKRLRMYSQNLVDYHLVMDLVPLLAYLYFLDRMSPDLELTLVQKAIFLGIGLQHKTVEEIEKDINLPATQILGLFNRVIRRMSTYFNSIVEQHMDKELFEDKFDQQVSMVPTKLDLKTELKLVASEIKHKQEELKAKLLNEMHLANKYAIKTNEDWDMDQDKDIISKNSALKNLSKAMEKTEKVNKSLKSKQKLSKGKKKMYKSALL